MPLKPTTRDEVGVHSRKRPRLDIGAPAKLAQVEQLTDLELEAALDTIRSSPTDLGTVELLVCRTAVGERDTPLEIELDTELGVVGDNWSTRPNRRTPAGGPDPNGQVTLVNARALAVVAGDRAAWPQAGDQLYVDFDLSARNLPPGSRVVVGDAVLELTAKPHLGCAKYARAFGRDAVRFVNSPEGKALRLRGANAKVVRSGVVRVGDEIRKSKS